MKIYPILNKPGKGKYVFIFILNERAVSLFKTIAAIAVEVGFKTQNCFIVNFKKVTGITSSVYRGISNES